MAISVGVAHDQYGNDELYAIMLLFYFIYLVLILYNYKTYSCWIETGEGAIWAFVAPMLVIITVSAKECCKDAY